MFVHGKWDEAMFVGKGFVAGWGYIDQWTATTFYNSIPYIRLWSR